MNTLIILPTYNEADNIVELLGAIGDLSLNVDICVVDDNSPDGTSKLVSEYQKNSPFGENVHLITRKGKSGRGDAVRAGLYWGLTSKSYNKFVEMDCDFSHHPKYLKTGIDMLDNCDVVLGSRYPDGRIEGWPLIRKILSFCSNILIRALLVWKNADYTNGFRFYNLKSAKRLCSVKQEYKGYIYLSETLAILLKEKFTIESFPIVFVNRVKGKSNTTMAEITNSLKAVFKIAIKFNFGKYETVTDEFSDLSDDSLKC